MEHIDWQVDKSSSECNKYILENEVDCDVSFKVSEDQEVIKAHRFILRMRSPVFDRMFNGGFQESETDPVIPDVSAAAFRALLRYCYYECLDIEGDIALSVLYTATKYMLPILDRAARKTLIAKVDTSMIWDVCKYSSEVGDDDLHAAGIEYLKENLSSSNILDVIKYAVSTGHEELHIHCREHLNENLSETNILDVTKYVVSIDDKEFHATCRSYLKTHLSGSNLWEVYTYALKEGEPEVHQHCRKYFERDVTLVRVALQSEGFLNIQHQVLLDVLHINDKVAEAAGAGYNPGISISEIELFKACNAWAEAECLRQKIDPTGANKRTVLGECLSLIRLPTMLQKDLLTIVYPTGILTQAGIANLGQYIHQGPSDGCQLDFPSQQRQFLMTPPVVGSISGSISTVYIESAERLMLSRLWTWVAGSYRITVRDEMSHRSWSMELESKHENHLMGGSDFIISYFDIEPPQLLEAGSRYSITAECTQGGTTIRKTSGVEYIRMPVRFSPYNELEFTWKAGTATNIYSLTLSLV